MPNRPHDRQFATLHNASRAVCPIAPVRMEGSLELARSTATAFLWREGDGWFLVTNWHNVTGINPDTGRPIGSFSPTALEVTLQRQASRDGDKVMVQPVAVVLDLYADDRPIWWEHPSRHLVDCVVVPLGDTLPSDVMNKALNETDFVADYRCAVGDECFVIGYPNGLSGRGRTPVWKRASVATEPDLDHDRLPLLLVDTATRPGMSGSPVVVRHSGIYMPNGPMLQGNEIIGTIENFLGVYSGRVGDDPLGVQLGRVWKASVLTEILNAEQLGLHPLDVHIPPID